MVDKEKTVPFPLPSASFYLIQEIAVCLASSLPVVAWGYRRHHPERNALCRVLFRCFYQFLAEDKSCFEKERDFFRPIIKEVTSGHHEACKITFGISLNQKFYRRFRASATERDSPFLHFPVTGSGVDEGGPQSHPHRSLHTGEELHRRVRGLTCPPGAYQPRMTGANSLLAPPGL